MAQALIKVNMSPKLRKNIFFAQKMFTFSKFPFLVKSSFLKTIFTHSKNQPHTLAQHVLTQQIPIKFSCYYKPPRRPKSKPNTRPFKRAIVRFSGTRSCGDINYLKFLIRIFENLQKRPGQLGLSGAFWKKTLSQRILVSKAAIF